MERALDSSTVITGELADARYYIVNITAVNFSRIKD